MVRITITGGIACGKSRVGSILQKEGIPVSEADRFAHEVIEQDGAAFAEVVNVFGKGVCGSDGNIDRRLLGDLVFSDPDARSRLESIVHPLTKEAWLQWIREKREEQPRRGAVAVIIPLLFETQDPDEWDAVICVSSSRKTQIARLNERGLPREQAVKRIEAQMPLSRKMELADYVIINNATIKSLEEQMVMVLRTLLEIEHGA